MAKKRPRPRKAAPHRRPRTGSGPLPDAGFFDRRAIEGVMWGEVIAAMGGHIPDTPLKRAQTLVYQAFGKADPAERVRLAGQALEISPDCADAHVLLAEHARSPREGLEHYELGVAAGERALGPSFFQEEAGHFWGILESRPYLRAREGLADTLRSAARGDQAIDHFREMLRLNPDDNQGIRFKLVACLLTLGRDDEIPIWLERYPDAACNSWLTRALMAFRRRGDTPEGRRLLQIGHKSNRFIVPWLLGDEPFPPERPHFYTPRSPEEAYFYVLETRCAWRTTPGAITWLRRTFAPPVSAPDPTTAAFRPRDADRARLRQAPSSFESWQAGFRRIPMWMKADGEKVVPWVIVIGSRSLDLVLESTILTKEPGAAELWDAIAKAIDQPACGEPGRPAEIEVRPDPRWDQLRLFVDEIGIELRESASLDVLDAMLESLTGHLLRDEPPGLLDMPRVTPAMVGSLFRAAADFYRQAPWRYLADRYAVRVECRRFQSGPWSAVVMGQAGQTLGLALYDRVDQLRDLWSSGPDSERDVARGMTSLALTFDREVEVSPKDVDAASRHGWEVVDPEVFPAVYRKEPGLSLRPPLSWELVLLEGCLRAIPAFLTRHVPNDGARSEMTVPVAAGELDLILSWVDEQ